jgi:uncharacterized protein DUF6786
MPFRPLFLALTASLMTTSCASVLSDDSPTFLEQAGFLEQYADGRLMLSGTGGFVYSASLQGRVMTSCLDLSEPGLGFLNRAVIENPPEQGPFTNYGGEDRFWIGPEGSRFSLYFDPGAAMEQEFWRVPADLDSGPFDEIGLGKLVRHLRLTNIAGTIFEMRVERTLDAPNREAVEKIVGELPTGTFWTSFRSKNRVINKGPDPWTKAGGLPCIWILGMFNPSPRAMSILPFRTDRTDPDGGPAVRTDYFRPLDDRRLRLADDFALFKTDAKFMSKVGVLRNRARNVMAAFDPETQVLTLVVFTPVVESAPYVNERWTTDGDAYYGDVVNSYNHGGPEPFFELESSSPALELEPGESYTHTVTTIHLRFAEEADLAAAVQRSLGLDWSKIKKLAKWK